MECDFQKKFSRSVIDQGYDFYENGLVGNVSLKGNVHSAKVESKYHVEITVDCDTVSKMHCDCQHSTIEPCKHMVAMILTIQNIEGQQNSFNEESSNPYLQEWNIILTDAEFIDYDEYDDVCDLESNTLQLLNEIEEVMMEEPHVYFKICTILYKDLIKIERLDYYGCSLIIASYIQGILKKLLECGDSNLKQEIRTWLQASLKNRSFKAYDLDDGLDTLYIMSTPFSKRVSLLQTMIASDTEDEYAFHCGKYIDVLIETLKKSGKNNDEIYQELVKYDCYTPAINWMIKHLLSKKKISQAIEYIKKGYCQDERSKYDYHAWLIKVYKENGFIKEYNMEMQVYIASGSKDAFTFYEAYRNEFNEREWREKRDRILKNIQDKGLLASCYYLEKMPHKLMKTIEDCESSLYYLQKYEDLLFAYDDAKFFSMHINKCDELCKVANSKNYEEIYRILLYLKTLKNGEHITNNKRDELILTYRRRPSLVKLLKSI